MSLRQNRAGSQDPADLSHNVEILLNIYPRVFHRLHKAFLRKWPTRPRNEMKLLALVVTARLFGDSERECQLLFPLVNDAGGNRFGTNEDVRRVVDEAFAIDFELVKSAVPNDLADAVCLYRLQQEPGNG